MILGMPSRSTGAVYQTDEPLVSDAFSSTVSSDKQPVDVEHDGHRTFLIGRTTRAPISAAAPAE